MLKDAAPQRKRVPVPNLIRPPGLAALSGVAMPALTVFGYAVMRLTKNP
jgi:hypothetical protein